MIIAVYGSLRKGFGNNRLLAESELLSTETVNIPFRMVSLGGFPGLVPVDDNNEITIEVYEVDDRTYADIERLEGYPNFYQKAKIQTTQGEADIYILEDKHYLKYAYVEPGDWKKYRTEVIYHR